MLKLNVILSEDFEESTRKIVVQSIDIELEHSLVSLSKWEEKWKIPLLSQEEKSDEQNFDYLQIMCVTPNVATEVFYKLTQAQQNEIAEYLETQHTATWFSNQPEAKSGEVVTAELIYFWMDSFRINWEAQHWNLSRLLTLVQVHSAKQDNKPKQQSTRSRQAEIAQMNARRRAEMGSNG